jgi:WD40 repeat protein
MGAGLKGDFTQTDNMTRLPTKTIKGFKCAAFSPDGSHALVVGEHGAVLKFDPVSGHFIPLTSGATKNLEAVAFSPDGKEAIIVGEGGTILKYTPPVQ